MCVIFIVDEKRPTDEMVEKAFHANDAGAGIAWRENGTVRWEKGISDIKEIQELCATLPTPYVAHFRIPTEGGRRPALCHPFPIQPDVPLELSGATDGYVLFHNGHWTDWRKDCKEAAYMMNKPLPMGKWSDTRGMAFVASCYGLGILEWINEKAVAFGPNDIEVIPGTGWHQEEGLWCSNLFWKHRSSGPHYGSFSSVNRICNFGTCKSYDTDSDGRCPLHRKNPPSSKASETTGDSKDKEEDQPGRVIAAEDLGGKSLDPKKALASVGGDATRLPFALAWRLYQQGDLSRKQYRKARRKHEKDMKKKGKNFSMETFIANMTGSLTVH